MKSYEFDVLLKGVAEISDEQADALFAAGCDDGTPASCAGRAWVHFDREAPSLEEAIRSAVGHVQSAGFEVSKVEYGGPGQRTEMNDRNEASPVRGPGYNPAPYGARLAIARVAHTSSRIGG